MNSQHFIALWSLWLSVTWQEILRLYETTEEQQVTKRYLLIENQLVKYSNRKSVYC
jgi:hypothetical protein